MEKKENHRTGEKVVTRDKNGRFTKGSRANPGGRPKTDEEFKEALKKLVPRSIEVLHEILMSEEASNKDKLRAVEVIFDRVYGKPYQAVHLDDIDTSIRITIDGGDQYGD